MGGGTGARLAGLAIGQSGFLARFGVAAFLVVVPALLYLVWFAPMDERRRADRLVLAGATGAK